MAWSIVTGSGIQRFTNGLLARLPGPGIANLRAKTLNFEIIPDLQPRRGDRS